MVYLKVSLLVLLTLALSAASFIAGTLWPATPPATEPAPLEAAPDASATGPVPAPVMTKPADQDGEPPAARAARIDKLLSELDRRVTADGRIEFTQYHAVHELCRGLIAELKTDRARLLERSRQAAEDLQSLKPEAKKAATRFWASATVLLPNSYKEENKEFESLYRGLGVAADMQYMSFEKLVAQEQERLSWPLARSREDLEKAGRVLDVWAQHLWCTEETTTTSVERTLRRSLSRTVHRHDLLNARARSLDEDWGPIPRRVRELIDAIPAWLLPLVTCVRGVEIAHTHEGQTLLSQTTTETATEVHTELRTVNVYRRDPCLVVGDFVLTGWEDQEEDSGRWADRLSNPLPLGAWATLAACAVLATALCVRATATQSHEPEPPSTPRTTTHDEKPPPGGRESPRLWLEMRKGQPTR